MRLAVTLIVLLLAVGCSPLRPPETPLGASPERCERLDDRASVWGAVGAGTGLLGGASGLATIQSDDPAAQRAMAIAGLTAGAIAAGAQYLSHESARAYIEGGCK